MTWYKEWFAFFELTHSKTFTTMTTGTMACDTDYKVFKKLMDDKIKLVKQC